MTANCIHLFCCWPWTRGGWRDEAVECSRRAHSWHGYDPPPTPADPFCSPSVAGWYVATLVHVPPWHLTVRWRLHDNWPKRIIHPQLLKTVIKWFETQTCDKRFSIRRHNLQVRSEKFKSSTKTENSLLRVRFELGCKLFDNYRWKNNFITAAVHCRVENFNTGKLGIVKPVVKSMQHWDDLACSTEMSRLKSIQNFIAQKYGSVLRLKIFLFFVWKWYRILMSLIWIVIYLSSFCFNFFNWHVLIWRSSNYTIVN